MWLIIISVIIGFFVVFVSILKGWVMVITAWFGSSLGSVIFGWFMVRFVKPHCEGWWMKVICDTPTSYDFSSGPES